VDHEALKMNKPSHIDEIIAKLESLSMDLLNSPLEPVFPRWSLTSEVRGWYNGCEEEIKAYEDWWCRQKDSSKNASHTIREIRATSTLESILGRRKRAFIQNFPRIFTLPPHCDSKRGERRNLTLLTLNDEYSAIEKAIGKFYTNGWRDLKRGTEEKGETNFLEEAGSL
jgi:hypothetical protein